MSRAALLGFPALLVAAAIGAVLAFALTRGSAAELPRRATVPSIARDAPAAVPAPLRVESTTLLTTGGLRPTWSPNAADPWVYFDAVHVSAGGQRAAWALHRIRPDGSGRACLTCSFVGETAKGFPGHIGSPDVHPGGRWVVVSVEQGVHAPVVGPGADPGGGAYNDLAFYDAETGALHRVRTVNNGIGVPNGASYGSLHPHFSHDGTKLLWADLIGGAGPGEVFARFRIAVADVALGGSTPRLENLRYFSAPGLKLIVTAGWASDDSAVYASCRADPGQHDYTNDICEISVDPGGGSMRLARRLVQTSGTGGEAPAYEEHGLFRPGDSGTFVFISSLERPIDLASPGLLSWLSTDYWVLDRGATVPYRLTYFNAAAGGRVVASKFGWEPGGGRFVASVWRVGREGDSSDDVLELRIISVAR